MTFNELLLESTYDMNTVSQLAKYIQNRFVGKTQRRIEIINKVREYFPWATQSALFYVKLINKIKGVEADAAGAVGAYNYRKENEARLPIVEIELTMSPTGYRFQTDLEHELVHALDFLRAYKEDRRFPNLKGKKNFGKEFLTYKKDPMEFNQVINAIKPYINNPEYHRIKTIEKLIKWIFVQTSSFGPAATEASLDKHFLRDEDLKRKIVLRLNREGMLPKAMQKVNSK